jgi:MoaA/NifB/PqqE/SkfB family radical SAM enzyme
MKTKTIFFIVFRNFESFIRDILGLPTRPYKVLFELTDHCNSRCLTCSIWKPSQTKTHFSPENADQFLSDYGQNITWIALSGGEVTVYPYIKELTALIKKYCPYLKIITFTTNGLLPNRVLEIAKELKDLGADLFVTISLDGEEDLHDQIRGTPGGYKKALETSARLAEFGVQAYLGLTISEYNIEYLKSAGKNAQKMKSISFAHSGGIYSQENMLDPSISAAVISQILKWYRINKISEIVEWIYLKLSYNFFVHNKKSPIACEALSTNLHIRPNGSILPCMFLPKIASIEDKIPMKKILVSNEVKRQIREIKKLNCPQCWMNCYAPHSIMRHPIQSILRLFQA